MNRVLLKTPHFLILISQTKPTVGLKIRTRSHKNREIFKGSGKKMYALAGAFHHTELSHEKKNHL